MAGASGPRRAADWVAEREGGGPRRVGRDGVRAPRPGSAPRPGRLAPAGGAGIEPAGRSNLCARSLRPPWHQDGFRAHARAAEASRPPAGAHGTLVP